MKNGYKNDQVEISFVLLIESCIFFSGKLAGNLNQEQKKATMYIARMNKSENKLPYLLFGPAGIVY